MQFILTCPNGKKIDMTRYIGKQMEGELTRQDVEKIITNYQKSNQNV